jgi:NadR type nicotinamide-nucleotide adenylyltransferase
MEKATSNQIRIAIVGPESSGKTTLCQQLSTKLDADWVPEFAREYLSEKSNYIQADLDFMLQQQLISEKEHKSPILFCDGDPISFKVWSLYKYGSVSPYIEKMISSHTYDFFLLLRTDLPFEEDPLRENSSLKNRNELYGLFKSELNEQNLNHSSVEGLNKNRLNLALNLLNKEKLI